MSGRGCAAWADALQEVADDGQREHVGRVEDAHDEQDSSDAGQLVLVERTGRLGPVGRLLEADGEQDERREDQVVGDVGEHQVALAGVRIGSEDIGGVGAPEPFDERPERDGDRDQHDVGDQFDDPPGHVDPPVVDVGERQRQGEVGGDECGDADGEATPESAPCDRLFERALDAGEQIGVFDHGAAGVVERSDQPPLDLLRRQRGQRRHTCSRHASSLRAGIARPRCSIARRRCVLTELTDTPSAAAICSMLSSSK